MEWASLMIMGFNLLFFFLMLQTEEWAFTWQPLFNKGPAYNEYMNKKRLIDRSKISALAEQIDGQILQMSDKAWVSKLAYLIFQKFNLPNPIAHISNQEDLRAYLEEKIKTVNIESLIKVGSMGDSKD